MTRKRIRPKGNELLNSRSDCTNAPLRICGTLAGARRCRGLRRSDGARRGRKWAQAVKNPDGLVAKHVRQIDVRQLICLTGTPVENHLDELWSWLRRTVPPLFGDRTAFRKQYRTPIEKHGDAERRAALARRVRPFLLRRTKEQVATELTARTETHERANSTAPSAISPRPSGSTWTSGSAISEADVETLLAPLEG